MPIERRMGEWVFYVFVGMVGEFGGFFGFCYISGLNYMAACLVFSLLELLGIFHQLFLKNTHRHHWNSVFVFLLRIRTFSLKSLPRRQWGF